MLEGACSNSIEQTAAQKIHFWFPISHFAYSLVVTNEKSDQKIWSLFLIRREIYTLPPGKNLSGGLVTGFQSGYT